jgi:hypothetical protein
MSQRNTQNIDTNPFEEVSEEYLVKAIGRANSQQIIGETNDKLLSIQKLSTQAKAARDLAYRKLEEEAQRKSEITREEIKERQKAIDDSLKELYKRPPTTPVIDDKFGKAQLSHKDKLAFVYIGDVAKSQSQDSVVNAPKIALAVGGGLEFAFNPVKKETNKIFPQENKIEGVSAQLHLVSLADIDVKGILPISILSNRSAITANADVLEFSANEMVIIRSLGPAYNSKGSKVMAPGGVHIVSGQNSGDDLIKEPEPMVLGKKLSDVMLKIVEFISEINSTIISMNSDMLTLKTALMSHFHVAGPPGSPTTPSVELIAIVAPTIPTKTVVNISNGYSSLVNLEMLKTNSLTALSKDKFISDYNRVN